MSLSSSPARSGAEAGSLLGFGFGLGAAAIWAGYMVVSAGGVRSGLGALELTFLRALVAGLLVLPLFLVPGARPFRDGPFWGLGWGRAMVLAACAGPFYSLAVVGGLGLAPASHGVIVTPGLIPVMGTLASGLVLGIWPSGRSLIGLACVVAGVLAVGWEGMSSLTGPYAWVGDLCFAGAALLWSIFTVAMKVWGVPPMRAVAVVSLLSLLYLPPYMVFVGLGSLSAADPWAVGGQALYQGVLVAVLAMALYGKAVGLLGPGRAALFPALVPVLGTGLTVLVLGEQPGPGAWAGMVLATLGMLLAVFAAPRAASASKPR